MISIIITIVIIGVVYIITYQRVRERIDYYPNKKIKYRSQYVKHKGNQILHGSTVYFYDNGKIKAEFEYIDGVQDGIQTYYNMDGSIDKREIFKRGNIVHTILP